MSRQHFNATNTFRGLEEALQAILEESDDVREYERNQFREIKRNLHLVNNDEAINSSDKMFKIRSLADILMTKFNQWGVFHESISIDESMAKYYGHHPSKQFNRGKPVRFGYKN